MTPTRSPERRWPSELLLWGGVLGSLLAYLSWSAAQTGRYLPGEKALLEVLGGFFFSAKADWNGSLSSVSRQDVLIEQVAIFFLPATAAWAMAVRAALSSSLPLKGTMALVLAGSALLRFECIWMQPPLETDHHRYLWDGAAMAAGLSLHYFYFLAWSSPVWSKPLEYVPAYLLLGWDVRRWLGRRQVEETAGASR